MGSSEANLIKLEITMMFGGYDEDDGGGGHDDDDDNVWQ
jgi:hypothetical protein